MVKFRIVLYNVLFACSLVFVLSSCVSSEQSRLDRLVEESGVSFSVGLCSVSAALACYNPSDDSVTVTVLGLSYSDSVVLCALRHELRHKFQDDMNLIVYSADGSIANREWLEVDAYTNGCSPSTFIK